MNKIILILLIPAFFGLSIWSCINIKDNNYTNIDITKFKWEVVKIRKHGNRTYKTADESYILEFFDNNEFDINLDVNRCGGNYYIKDEGLIEFKGLGCTEKCCDSDFAKNLSALFLEMTEYYTTEDELILKGEGEIILRKYED